MAEEKKLNSKIKKGVIWTSLDFVSKAGLQFILQIILARLLVPEDFGLIGMAVVFTAIIRAFVDFGLGAALIQMKEEEITEEILSTTFWSGFLLNIVVYILVVFVIGPFAAHFYNEPLLIYIFPVLSFNIVVNSFNMVQLVRLTRQLNFRSIAIINTLSNVIAVGGAIVLAYLGFGVWSIAIHSPLIAVIALPLYYLTSKWVPKFYWRKDEFKRVFSFGIYTSGTQLANSMTSQADYLLIGRLLNKQQLGIYSLAFQMTSTLKSALMGIVAKVMYPVYAQIQDDRPKIRRYYGEIIKFNFMLIAPLLVFIALYAEFLVDLIFGDKWAETVPLIQLLSIATIIEVLASSNTSLIRAMGYPKLEFKIQFAKALLIKIPLFVIGLYMFGLIGVAYALIISAILSVIIAMYYMQKLTEFSYFDLGISIYKIIIILCIVVPINLLILKNTSSIFLSITTYLSSTLLLLYFFYKKELLRVLNRN